MNTKEARYLLAIAEHKNLSRASEALFVSQPSLTKFLKNEELLVGAPLFDRIYNEYRPTRIGERYLNYAHKTIELDELWAAEHWDLINMNKGQLNIAIPIVRSRLLIPPSITLFHQKYPGIKVSIFEEATNVEDLLKTRPDIDLAVYSTINTPQDLACHSLRKSETVLVVPSSIAENLNPIKISGFRYPWIDISLLKNTPFIMLESSQTNGYMTEKLLNKHKMLDQIWMRTRSSDVACEMAKNGCGCALISEEYAMHNKESDIIRIFSIGDDPIITYLIAAYRIGQYLPTYVRDYISILEHLVSTL